MNVKGVERIAQLMGHAGGQQRQRLDTLALDGFEGFLPRFSRIMQDQRDARAASGFAVQGSGVKANKARPGIVELEFVDRKSTRLNSSHRTISYAVFCLKKK